MLALNQNKFFFIFWFLARICFHSIWSISGKSWFKLKNIFFLLLALTFFIFKSQTAIFSLALPKKKKTKSSQEKYKMCLFFILKATLCWFFFIFYEQFSCFFLFCSCIIISIKFCCYYFLLLFFCFSLPKNEENKGTEKKGKSKGKS